MLDDSQAGTTEPAAPPRKARPQAVERAAAAAADARQPVAERVAHRAGWLVARGGGHVDGQDQLTAVGAAPNPIGPPHLLAPHEPRSAIRSRSSLDSGSAAAA